MFNSISLRDSVSINQNIDLLAKPLSDQEWGNLQADENNDFILEPVSLEELESTYFYDTLLHPLNNVMMEAITTSRMRISKTMRAFIRALNNGLGGTGIEAGVIESTDQNAQVIGGAEIGRVRKSNGLALLPARIPLTDGQSVSIIFHSPSGDTSKITASDTLVAFRFLLNKRDVTHIVAPMKGRDMSLRQVCLSLSNVIERNSKKFQRSQDKQKKLLSDIDKNQSDAELLEKQQLEWVEKGDELASFIESDESNLKAIQKQLSRQEAVNEKLQSRLDELQKVRKDSVTTMPSKIPSKNAHPSLPDITDTIRTIRSNTQIAGSSKLSNGATISMHTGSKAGSLVGFVEVKDVDGKVYQLESESILGSDMEVALRKLFKAYKNGKANKYIPTQEMLIPNNRLDEEKEPPVSPTQNSNNSEDKKNMADANNEVDSLATKALEFIKSVLDLNTDDINVIREKNSGIRNAIGALTNAGQYEENEGLVNQAAKHLGDLLDHLFKKGA